MNNLSNMQQAFQQAIFTADEERNVYVDLQQFIKANPRLNSQQQIDIYKNSVLASLSGALGQIFPVCLKLVGESFFSAMALHYVSSELSQSPDLADYGDTFADFIQSFPPARELVYLADVARLEWYWHRAFHAADSRTINIAELGTLSAEQYQSLSFYLAPGTHLLLSDYPVHLIWQANQHHDDQQIELQCTTTRLLIVRCDYEIHIEELTKDEWLFINAINQPQPFEMLCNELEQHQLDIPALLKKSVSRGWITDYSTGDYP